VLSDQAAEMGIVFNIQKYSVHDGPGIRTIIFLKGCSLKCAWCSNPESQSLQPQLAYNPDKCLTVDACPRCRESCPRGAISTGPDRKILRDAARCDDCLVCSGLCPSHALSVYGRRVSVADAIGRVEEDEIFYTRSGGVLTLSGGEPLFQDEFALALLREARRRRIDTSLETCGQVPWPALQQASHFLNSVYYDIKCMDPKRHLAGTGASNERILDNLVKLKTEFRELPVVVRTPVVPGFNDGEKEIAAIVDFIKDMPGTRYELLAYHRMGTPKYGYLGREYRLKHIGPISERRMAELGAFARSRLRTF
jgi:pyruvate formate lyase activating enzyme